MSLVSSQMVEILFQYVDRSLKKCPEQGKIQLLEQHFQVDEAMKVHVSPYRLSFSSIVMFLYCLLCSNNLSVDAILVLRFITNIIVLQLYTV